MSCGRPIIATKVSFIDEYIKDGINGFLVNKANEKELVKVILDMINDENLREKMGVENRKLAEEKFAVDKIQREWIQLYHEVLNL